MLTGQHNHQLDGKGRFRIPAKLKKDGGFGAVIYLVQGYNKTITVYNETEYQKFVAEKTKEATSGTIGSKVALGMSRLIGSIEAVEDDGQGRYQLPSTLKKFALIEKDIVTLGIINKLEIWSKERWDAVESSDDFDDVLDEYLTQKAKNINAVSKE